ncbi:hypothetical protein MRX96_001694 [Rhipicephalus microplus]
MTTRKRAPGETNHTLADATTVQWRGVPMAALSLSKTDLRLIESRACQTGLTGYRTFSGRTRQRGTRITTSGVTGTAANSRLPPQQQRRDGRADQEPKSPPHTQQQHQPVQATDSSVRPLGCTRCGDRVYPKEMVTPKPGVLLHSGCFKCRECGVKLTLQTFFTNQRDTRDMDVYCRTHVPRLGPGTVDGNALNILTSKNSREIKFSRYPKASDTELSSQDDG